MEGKSPASDQQLAVLTEQAAALRKSLLEECAVLLTKASEVEVLHAALRSKLPVGTGQPPAAASTEPPSAPKSASAALTEASPAAVARAVEGVLKSAADLFSRASAVGVAPVEKDVPAPLSSAAFSHILVEAFNSARQDAQYSHDPQVVVDAFSFVNLALQAAVFAESTTIPAIADTRPRPKLNPIAESTPVDDGRLPRRSSASDESSRQLPAASTAEAPAPKHTVGFAEDPLPVRRSSDAASGEPSTTGNVTAALKEIQQTRRPSIYMSPDDSTLQPRTFASPEEREADRERRALLFAASDRGRRSSFFDEASQRRASIIALGTDDPKARRQSIYKLTGQDENAVRRAAGDTSALAFRRPSFVGPDGRETEVGSMTAPQLAYAAAGETLPFKPTPGPQSFAENLPEAPLPPKIPAQVLAAWSTPSANMPVPSSIVSSTALSTFDVSLLTKKRKDRDASDADEDSANGKKPHFSSGHPGQKGVAY